MKRFLCLLLALAALSAGAAVTPLPGVTPQRAPALTPFPHPVEVRITDSAGQPVMGAKAYLSQGPGILQLAPGATGDCWIDFMIVFVCRATADADGVARFPAMMARYAETFTAVVHATNDLYPNTVNYGEATLQFTSDMLQAPAHLTIAAGNDQSAVIGTPLSPITVRLTDADGRPLRQATLWYSPIANGPGGFDYPSGAPAEVHTDDSGSAILPRFTAAWGVGDHEAQVRYFDPQAAAHLTATIRYRATNAQGGLTLELGDLWWGGPSESGWGMSVTQRGDRLFNVWFVYDDASRPTWFVQPGGQWIEGVGSGHWGAVYWPRGTPWYAYDASQLVAGHEVGQGSVNFAGPEAAWASFNARLNDQNHSWYKALVRQPFGSAEASPLPGVGGLWWGGASQNGWGVAIHEHGAQLFIVWFTYDAEGVPTWFVMPEGTWTDSRTHAGTIYRTSGPPWTQASFDTSTVRATAVGTYRLRFSSTDDARMEATIEGRSIAVDVARQVF